MLTGFTVVIISKYLQISNIYVVHLKQIRYSQLYLNKQHTQQQQTYSCEIRIVWERVAFLLLSSYARVKGLLFPIKTESGLGTGRFLFSEVICTAYHSL